MACYPPLLWTTCQQLAGLLAFLFHLSAFHVKAPPQPPDSPHSTEYGRPGHHVQSNTLCKRELRLYFALNRA